MAKQSDLPGVPAGISHAEMLRMLTAKINEIRALKLSVADAAVAGRELSLSDRADLRTGCQRVASQLREVVLALQ